MNDQIENIQVSLSKVDRDGSAHVAKQLQRALNIQSFAGNINFQKADIVTDYENIANKPSQ